MVRNRIPVKDRLPAGRKKKPFDELTPTGQYYRKKFEENPEEHEKFLKDRAEYYRKNKPKQQKQKAEFTRQQSLKVIKLLGGKCVSCGELFDPNLKKTNLEIHHLYYDENDLRVKQRHGSISSNIRDVITMFENGKNPKEKYVLLCKQCHNIETYSHQDPKKTFDMFCWLYEQGIFEKVLNDDAKNNRKITEFLKQS